jgi:hypothetical protein
MIMPDNERWTPGDETALKELQERKIRIIEAAKNPIVRVAEALCHKDPESLAELLVQSAAEIRDALKPFDSRVQVTPQVKPT